MSGEIAKTSLCRSLIEGHLQQVRYKTALVSLPARLSMPIVSIVLRNSREPNELAHVFTRWETGCLLDGVALPAMQPSTRPDQSRVVCGDGGLQAVADAQFCQHALHVALHGGLREVELRTDLGVRQAACDQEQHVDLPS